MSIREPIREPTEYVGQAELDGLLASDLAVCPWCRGSGAEDNSATSSWWRGTCETCGGSGAVDPKEFADDQSS